MLAFPKEADEQQFGGGMRIQAPRNQEIGNGDAVGCFLPLYGERGERGGCDVGAGVDVGDNGEDGVEGCGEDLKGVSGFHGVAGVFHFGDEDEEHEMAFECWVSPSPTISGGKRRRGWCEQTDRHTQRPGL